MTVLEIAVISIVAMLFLFILFVIIRSAHKVNKNFEGKSSSANNSSIRNNNVKLS